MSVLIKAIIKW